jgi:hypothetical protein
MLVMRNSVVLGHEALTDGTGWPVTTTLVMKYTLLVFLLVDHCFAFFYIRREAQEGYWYSHEVMFLLLLLFVCFFVVFGSGGACAMCVAYCFDSKISHTRLSYCYYYQSIVCRLSISSFARVCH